MLSDGVVVGFHRAEKVLDWKNPANNTPIEDSDPIVLIDPNSGHVLSAFGKHVGFVIPHGVFVDRLDNIWVTDCGLHQVFKFSRDGTLLLTLGKPGGPLTGKVLQVDSDNGDHSRFAAFLLSAVCPA
eukprot:SAG31_NODE_12573_length_931_cov_2.223558_2_plen_127_part_00